MNGSPSQPLARMLDAQAAAPGRGGPELEEAGAWRKSLAGRVQDDVCNT